MPERYQDVYPSPPLLDSRALARPLAADLLTLEYFEAEPGTMPTRVFAQHHVLLNLCPTPHRTENWRDGEHRDFTFHKDEIVVTPAGVRSGWRWHARSKVIVVTLEPKKLERFAQHEVGVPLSDAQLKDLPRFTDADICQAGVLLKEALETRDLGADVLFESFARVFLVKLIRRYGDCHGGGASAKGLGARHYKRVLDHVAACYGRTITLDGMAREAGLSRSHFARLFKATIGQSPMRFVAGYRVERAKRRLAEEGVALIDVAHACGFADHAHFSRVFKQVEGVTPKAYREALRAQAPKA